MEMLNKCVHFCKNLAKPARGNLPHYVQHIFIYSWRCLGITILLSLSVFQLIVAEMVPATSLAVPLVGKNFLAVKNK